MSGKVLLIEDEKRLRRVLQLVLEEAGYEVRTAADGGEGISIWQSWRPHVVVTDLKMQPVDGMEVLRFGSEQHGETPCIILTAFGTVTTAVDAMKIGAYDFLTKPVDHSQLVEVVQQAMDERGQRKDRDYEMIGDSPQMDQVRREIRLLASTDSAVLIQGESGTGKELAARAIHAASARSRGPFVRINCASIPRELLESELFGHRKGSFTGATENRQGVFSAANGGVLFLDEIGDLPLELQPKLLHAVEEKEITPVGSREPQSVSVKILSATNQDLEEMVRSRRFRADLFYRLNTMVLKMPPLRERVGDVKILSEHFVRVFANELGRSAPRIGAEALGMLEAYQWPGNVRQLRNVMERAVLLCEGDEIGPNHLPDSFHGGEQGHGKKEETSSLDLVAKEQEMLLRALEQCNWNQSKAARKLNITRSALRYRLQKYGIGKK